MPDASPRSEPAAQAVTVRLTGPIDDPSPDPAARRRRTSPTVAALGIVAVLAVGASGWGFVSALRPASGSGAPRDAAFTVDPATVTASASSTQRHDGDVSYDAANTLDGDPSTAWNSDGARDGSGKGIALTYRFASAVDLRSVSLLNGYQKLRRRSGHTPVDLYAANGRLRRVRVVTDRGTWTWDLADSRSRQTLSGIRGTTRSVRLDVVSVYPSGTYPDLAVSEVGFTAAATR